MLIVGFLFVCSAPPKNTTHNHQPKQTHLEDVRLLADADLAADARDVPARGERFNGQKVVAERREAEAVVVRALVVHQLVAVQRREAAPRAAVPAVCLLFVCGVVSVRATRRRRRRAATPDAHAAYLRPEMASISCTGTSSCWRKRERVFVCV